jgi:DNA-binding NarL/FixJ family response regulator
VRSTIRVVVRDPRRLIAEALSRLISTMDGFAVLSGEERGGGLLAAGAPDLVILSVGPSAEGLLQRVQALRGHVPAVEIVVLADHLDPALVSLVLEQRLSGLLLTDSSAADLAISLQQVAHGHAVLPSGWQRLIAEEPDDPVRSLSARQLQVLELLTQGLSYEEIGARLFISTNTVKFHVRSIFVRLGVRNRMAAAHVFGRRTLRDVAAHPVRPH